MTFLWSWESKCHTAEFSITCPLFLSWRFNLVLRILLCLADFLGVQQLWLNVQVHWHLSRLRSRSYCAAADTFCWRHVLLSPHTNAADLMLWGSFRRHRKHSVSGYYQRCCLHAIQLLCSCSARLVHPWSIRCPYQRHVYADHLCSKLTACVYAVTSQKLKQSKGKKSIRSFNLIHGMNWNNLRMALFASIKSHLKKGTSCLCLMLVAWQ